MKQLFSWKIFIIFILFCLATAGSYLLFHKTEPVIQPTVLDNQKMHKLLQEEFFIQNQGFIYDDYAFHTYHLTLNQTHDFQYDSFYPADNLLWSYEKDGEVFFQKIATGKLLHLFTVNNSPFIKTPEGVFIVFHLNEGTTKQPYLGSGYVFEVTDNHTLHLVYETPEAFDDLTIDDNGRILISQRHYLDERNQYPSWLKPYDKITYRMEKNKVFTSFKHEKVQPNLTVKPEVKP
jgi:hypothetical protein